MSTTLDATTNTAKTTTASAGNGTAPVASSTRSTLLGSIRAAAGVVSTIRDLHLGDALTLIRLARSGGPVGSIALFGAGVLVGAGAGLLFADKPGAETRRALLDRVKGLRHDAKKTVDTAQAGAKDLEGKAGGIVGKAKDSVVSAEHKLENTVTESFGMARDAIKHTAESAILAAKETTEDVKWVLVSVDPFHHPAPKVTASKPDTGAGKANSGAGSANGTASGKANSGAGNHRAAPARHH